MNDNTAILSNAGLRDGDTLNIKILVAPLPGQQTSTATAPLNELLPSKSQGNDGAVATQNGFIILRVKNYMMDKKDNH